MTEWAQSTIEKLGDSVFQILAEVGILSESAVPFLQKVHYENEIMEYLRTKQLDEVARAMQAFM